MTFTPFSDIIHRQWFTGATMLFLTITLIPATLWFLHFVTGIRTKGDLKEYVLNLYVVIDGLTERDKTIEALRKLKSFMKRSRKWFFLYFALSSFLCFISTFPFQMQQSREQFEEPLLKLAEEVIDLHFQLSFKIGSAIHQQGFFYTDDGKSCVERPVSRNFVDSRFGQKERIASAIRGFSDTQLREVYALSEAISDLFTFMTVGLAIFVSMRVTLFFLSHLAGSKIILVISIVLSLAVAFLSPFIFIDLTTYFGGAATVALWGGLPDFFGIDKPSVLNVATANATTLTLVQLNPESVFALLLHKALPDSRWVEVIFDAVVSVATIPVSWQRLAPFLDDLNRFNKFDFGVSEIIGIRNWGVGTDMAFSLSYLLLSILLVIANRKEAVREYMLKQLQEIDSSSDGPFLSLASKTKILFGALIAFVALKG